jgi:hypothetical protein
MIEAVRAAYKKDLEFRKELKKRRKKLKSVKGRDWKMRGLKRLKKESKQD